MEISRAGADNSNYVSHLSISHLYDTLNPKTDREFETLINPIFSEWKSVGLELTIPMMFHTYIYISISIIMYKSPLRHLKVMGGCFCYVVID